MDSSYVPLSKSDDKLSAEKNITDTPSAPALMVVNGQIRNIFQDVKTSCFTVAILRLLRTLLLEHIFVTFPKSY